MYVCIYIHLCTFYVNDVRRVTLSTLCPDVSRRTCASGRSAVTGSLTRRASRRGTVHRPARGQRGRPAAAVTPAIASPPTPVYRSAGAGPGSGRGGETDRLLPTTSLDETFV